MVDRALNASEVYKIVYPPVQLILNNVAKVDKNQTLIESLIRTEQLNEHHNDLKQLKAKHQLSLEDIHEAEDLIRGELTDTDNLTEARINSNNLKKRALEQRVNELNNKILEIAPNLKLDLLKLTVDELLDMDYDELSNAIRNLTIRRQTDIIANITKKLEDYQQAINADRRRLVNLERSITDLNNNPFNILKQLNEKGNRRFLTIIYSHLKRSKNVKKELTDKEIREITELYVNNADTPENRELIKEEIKTKYGVNPDLVSWLNEIVIKSVESELPKYKEKVAAVDKFYFDSIERNITKKLDIINEASEIRFKIDDHILRDKIGKLRDEVKKINDDIIMLNEENSKISMLISKYDTADNIKKELDSLSRKDRIDIYNKLAEDDILLQTRMEKANSLIKPSEHKVISFEEVEKYDSIAELMDGNQVLLLIYRSEPTFGHWVILVRNKFGLNFFDSYGRYIDDAAKSINPYFSKMTGQDKPHLLKLLSEHTMPVHYNDYQLQKYSPKIQTCGRWCGYYGNKLRRGESMNSINTEFRKYKGDKDKLIVELTDPYLT